MSELCEKTHLMQILSCISMGLVKYKGVFQVTKMLELQECEEDGLKNSWNNIILHV